ncbi:MAG: Ldh family oxidoreductase [Acidobacteria bacterium]|nr:Ldh family oxidoreductase [Acidobacteriota bacterium]
MAAPFDAVSLRQFTVDIFQACGAPAAEAAIVADHLIAASLMGYDTHGVIRIPQYVEDVKREIIRPGAPLQVTRETETTAVLDCGWNFGQVGGVRAMELAIAKARRWHVAMIVARRSNHAGRLGAYTQMAAEQGLLAIGVCNSPRHGHFVLPWGGREGRLATNPISFAVPSDSGAPIMADFSTAETTEGALRLYRNLGKPLPSGWIVDAQGQPSTDPADFYGPPQGAILPFGGGRGYRGFALSLLVEVLGGLLGGSSITIDQPGNGLGFIVIDVSTFLAPREFAELIRELRAYIKSSPPASGFDEVQLPGEPDFRTRQQRLRHGIPIDKKTCEQIRSAAASVGVAWRSAASSEPEI